MKVVLELDGEEHEVFLQREGDKVKITIEGETFEAKIQEGGIVEIGDRRFEVGLQERGVSVDGREMGFRIVDLKTGAAGDAGGGGRGARIKPPMPGKIVSVAVNEGDEVKAGQVLVILEAMKMQNEIPAPVGGTVKKVHVSAGQNVEGKDILIELE